MSGVKVHYGFASVALALGGVMRPAGKTKTPGVGPGVVWDSAFNLCGEGKGSGGSRVFRLRVKL